MLTTIMNILHRLEEDGRNMFLVSQIKHQLQEMQQLEIDHKFIQWKYLHQLLEQAKKYVNK